MNTQTGDQSSMTQSFYRHDWLLKLLLDKWHFTAGWAYILTTVIGLIIQVVLPALMDRSSLNESNLLITLPQCLVVMPLGAVLYVVVPGMLARFFEDLRASLVVPPTTSEEDQASYTRFVAHTAAAGESVWWKLVALVFMALYAYYRLAVGFNSDFTGPFPPGQRLVLRLAFLALYLPLIYAATTTIGRILTSLFSTPRLFRLFETQVNPLSPEGAGGLGKLGSMLIGSVLIATALGAAGAIMIIMNIASQKNIWSRPETIALWIVYLIFTPLILYCWLWAPHQALVRARSRAVQPLADEYRRVLSQSLPQEEDNLTAYQNRTELLEAIKAQHDLISDSYPVWPISTQSLKNLVATSSLPVVSPVITAALAWLTDRVLALMRLTP